MDHELIAKQIDAEKDVIEKAKQICAESGRVSPSLIQRRLSIRFSTAVEICRHLNEATSERRP